MSQRRFVRLASIGVCLNVGVLASSICVSALADDQALRKSSSGGDRQAAKSIVMPRSWKGLEGRVEEDGVAVAVSESGNTLYGFSARTGKTDRVRIQNPDGRPIQPLVGGGVACVVVGTHAYGFGETTGRWDVLEVSPAVIPTVSLSFCWIDDGSKTHMFSNSTGRWVTADLSQDVAVEGAPISANIESDKTPSIPRSAARSEQNPKALPAGYWGIVIDLEMPGLGPQAVQYTVFDKDPVPGYIAQVKRSQNVNRQQLSQAADDASRDQFRVVQMDVAWDRGFKEVTGDDLWLAKKTSESSSNTLTSNSPDGKKWVATKAVIVKGKLVCWCIPIEVKTGEQVEISFNERNVFDLQTPYENTISEQADPEHEKELK